MESDSIYPDWMYEAAYDDSVFAAAYEHVTAPQRALLKTCIARLYDWYGPSRVASTSETRQWNQGFTSLRHFMPRQRCLVLFDDRVGPAALLAAVMPPRVLGVAGVAVAYMGEGDPAPAILAALELAGQELVLPAARLQELLGLHSGPDGCVVTLGAARISEQHRGPLWSGPGQRVIGIFDPSGAMDREALVFAHPEAELEEVDRMDATSRCQALYADSRNMTEALEHHCLVFGPGHESCWVYPGLSPDFFHSTAIAWT